MRNDGTGAPTVKEIAAQCGVSEATVSRVLNSNYKHGFSVRPEVHKRIIEVADALGYRPNIAAKNLVMRQTKIIAFVGCDLALGWPGNIYQTIINSSVEALHEFGYNVCLTVPNLEESRTELPPWKVDGAIVLQECTPETIDEMERTNLPYVVVNGVAGPSGSSVIPDDVEATTHVMEYLFDLGHTKIAYAGPTEKHKKHQSITDRHETYLSELAKRGLEPVPNHEMMFDSAPAFLASSVCTHHATAILAYDHLEAIKIVHGAHVLGIQIPKQVSLVCFNNEYLCSIVSPPLTTIGVSSKRMGQMAADMLLKHLQSPADYQPETIKLSQEMIVRSSTESLIRQ
jgi:DNA-binding LacI/PurR family transcriptional regulator